MDRWLTALLGAATVLLMVGAAQAAPPCLSDAGDSVVYEGRAFAVADPVRLVKRAGTFKPIDTGHVFEVEAAAGNTGTIVCFGASPVTGRAELAVVTWDAQTWQNWYSSTGYSQDKVLLDRFSASVHLSYLRVQN